MAKFIVTGIPELDKRLRQLEPKVANKIGRDALRAEMAPVRDGVVDATPEDSGALKRSTKLRAGRRSRTKISVDVVMYDATDDGRFIASFVEFGTAETPAAGMMRGTFDRRAGQARRGIVERIRAGIEREA